MPRASRHADVPLPSPDLDAVAAEARAAITEVRESGDRIDALLGRLEKLADAAEAGAPLDGYAIALLISGTRQMGTGRHAVAAALEARTAELARLSLEDRVAGARLAAESRQEGASASGGRHRARREHGPAEDRPGFRLIPGGKKVTTAAVTAASLAAGMAAVTGGYSDLARYSPAPAAHHQVLGSAVLSPAVAVRIPPVSPAAYVPRHARPSADAASASPVPSPAPPSAAPLPQPPAPSAPPSASPEGVLDVQTATVVIRPDGTGTITITAAGGPVGWQAMTSDPALRLGQYEGRLADRQPGVIDVTIAPGSAAGSGTVTLTADGQQVSVLVTWPAVPDPAV